MIYGSPLFNGTMHFERPTEYQRKRVTKVPFTAKELKEMYGLTVEEALERGFSVLEHKQKKKPSKERQLRRTAQRKISQDNDITITEECQMKNTENIRTRLALVLCLMESKTFQSTDNNIKLEMLSHLLYDQPLSAEADAPKADKPKHPRGRPKKAAKELCRNN